MRVSQKVFLDHVFLAIPPDENPEFERTGACLIPQEGKSFGERLCHSIQQVFALGYERVLVLGNDCPQLDVQLLSRARERFKNATIILGPDQKGGVYLLGVTRESFQVLSDIEWNANTDFAQLVKVYGYEQPGESRYSPPAIIGTKPHQVRSRQWIGFNVPRRAHRT